MRVALLLAAVALTAACAGDDAREEPLTVFAASSLTEVFERLAPEARFNFAGSDELATQLREGARADVYAAASPRYPTELHEGGVVETPRVFATNRLVIVVPSDNPARIREIGDVARPGVKLVIGAPGVPIGDYTRAALDAAGRADVLEQVVSEEEDVKGVVGKVRLGEADAGFVYATDARAAGEAVRTIELPASAQTEVRYLVAVVRASDRRAEGQKFVDLLLSARAQRLLRAAGFGGP